MPGDAAVGQVSGAAAGDVGGTAERSKPEADPGHHRPARAEARDGITGVVSVIAPVYPGARLRSRRIGAEAVRRQAA